MADNYNDTDYDDNYDPATYKFGKDDELVAAYKDPDRVQQLVDAGHVVTANAIQAACHTGNERTLEILLSVKPNPDIRLAGSDSQNTGVEAGWAASDLTPHFGVDQREWYPLQLAANGPLLYYYGGKKASDTVQNVLLRHKPNLFAIFKQPIWRPDPFPFPGEDSSEFEDDESETSEESVDYMHSLDIVDGKWQHEPKPEFGYGLRSVLHSLLEDGGYIKPILEHPDLEIDLSHRDPQGRTLLHSVCRSSMGADALPSAAIEDLYGEEARENLKSLTAPEASETSLFHTLRKRGADLTSVDSNGKNILHHLLEARTPEPYSRRPPLIRNTLDYVLKHEPQLVNRPDQHGTYPLHTALQRLRDHFEELTVWIKVSPLEPVVHDLLDAGADATVQDSRGNTALHYLADNGLAEQLTRGIEARALCQRFCDAGVDVNARNHRGRTALEILMNDSGKWYDGLRRVTVMTRLETPPQPLEDIDAEVLSMFDKAGVLWNEQNPQGQTLLHLVAKHRTVKTAFRVKYLLDLGLDPAVKDHEGKTAEDVARESHNESVLEALERFS